MTAAEREFKKWIKTPGAKEYYNWKTGTKTFPVDDCKDDVKKKTVNCGW